MTRVVVLDVDGTLMDTNYLHVEAWARAFEAVDHRTPRWKIHGQIGKGADKLIPEFVSDEGAVAEADRMHGELYMQMQEHAVPIRGAAELIASLAERGYEVWFVTSAKPEELERYMDLLEAGDRVSGVVNSSDVEQSKPAPDVFELALEKAGARADETVSVGDSVWDIEAANGAGIRTVGVLTGGAFGEEALKAAGAVDVYEDCAALLASKFPE